MPWYNLSVFLSLVLLLAAPGFSGTEAAEKSAEPGPAVHETVRPTAPAMHTPAFTLKQALVTARQRNPALRIRVLERERAKAAGDRAWAGRYPTIGLGLSFSQALSGSLSPFGPTAQAAETSSPASPPTAGTSYVSVTYNLDTSGETSLRLCLAASQLQVAEAEVALAETKADLDVTLAYYDLQEAQARERIATAALANALISCTDAENLSRAGEATVFDVQRAKVHLARAKQARAAAERDRAIASGALSRLLGLGPESGLEASDQVVQAGTLDVSPAEALARALEVRPEVKRASLQIGAARWARDLALAGLGVRSRLFATRDGAPGALLSATNQSFSLGASVDWNPFDGGAAQAGAREAEAEEAAARVRLADSQNEIAVEIARAFAQLETSRKTIEFAAEALAIAQSGLASARKRFGSGVGTQSDIIDAENDLFLVEGDKVRSVLDYNRALAILRRAETVLPARD